MPKLQVFLSKRAMKLIHCEILILLLAVLTFQSVRAGEIRLIVRGDDLGMTQGSIAGFAKTLGSHLKHSYIFPEEKYMKRSGAAL